MPVVQTGVWEVLKNLETIFKLKRETPTELGTEGALLLGTKLLAFTLEDAKILWPGTPGPPAGLTYFTQTKTPKKTAIPAGRYRVILSYSQRFKRVLPELIGVPQFMAIRIHGGNTTEDTEGCILVGMGRTQHPKKPTRIHTCAEAVAGVIADIRAASKLGSVWLEVVNP